MTQILFPKMHQKQAFLPGFQIMLSFGIFILPLYPCLDETRIDVLFWHLYHDFGLPDNVRYYVHHLVWLILLLRLSPFLAPNVSDAYHHLHGKVSILFAKSTRTWVGGKLVNFFGTKIYSANGGRGTPFIGGFCKYVFNTFPYLVLPCIPFA